jgi:hypothetical protein
MEPTRPGGYLEALTQGMFATSRNLANRLKEVWENDD